MPPLATKLASRTLDFNAYILLFIKYLHDANCHVDKWSNNDRSTPIEIEPYCWNGDVSRHPDLILFFFSAIIHQSNSSPFVSLVSRCWTENRSIIMSNVTCHLATATRTTYWYDIVWLSHWCIFIDGLKTINWHDRILICDKICVIIHMASLWLSICHMT